VPTACPLRGADAGLAPQASATICRVPGVTLAQRQERRQTEWIIKILPAVSGKISKKTKEPNWNWASDLAVLGDIPIWLYFCLT